jgi:outer membrane lipoprotein-sorting protein
MKRTTAVLLLTAALVLALAFVVGCPKKPSAVEDGPPLEDPDRPAGLDVVTDAGDSGEVTPASGKLADLVKDRTPVESYRVEFEMEGDTVMADDEGPGIMTVQMVDGEIGRMKMEMPTGEWMINDMVDQAMYAYDPGEGRAMKVPMEGEPSEEMDIPTLVDDIDADVDVLGTETVDGVECFVVESAPPGEDEKAKICVDKEFGLIRKLENEEGTVTFKYSLINELTEDDFKVPEGIEVDDMADMMKGLEGLADDE